MNQCLGINLKVKSFMSLPDKKLYVSWLIREFTVYMNLSFLSVLGRDITA